MSCVGGNSEPAVNGMGSLGENSELVVNGMSSVGVTLLADSEAGVEVDITSRLTSSLCRPK